MTAICADPMEPLFTRLEEDGALAVVMTSETASTLVMEFSAHGAAVAIVNAYDLPCIAPEAVNRAVGWPGESFSTTWFVREGTSSKICDTNILPEWTLAGGYTAYLHSFTAPGETERRASYICPIEGERLTAAAGEVYRFSILVGLHRTKGRAVLSFFGPEGLIERHERKIPEGFKGGRRPDDYVQVAVSAIAPEGASSLSIEVIKEPTCEGQDSFLFFTQPRLWRGRGYSPPRPVDLPVELAAALFGRPDCELRLIPLTWTSDSSRPSELVVAERVNGRQLARFDFAPAVGAPFELEILGLERAALMARVTRVAVWCLDVTLALWIDGRPASEENFHTPCINDLLRIQIPIDFLDARPHVLQVKLAEGGRLLGECVEFTPDNLLSWGDLIRNRALPNTVARAPAAEHRYRALASAMGRIVGEASKANTADSLVKIQNIAQAHEIVAKGFDPLRRNYPVLQFDLASEPRVSIIIPVHDNFAVTFNCLAALILAVCQVSVEIIVVDDGSNDLTRDLPELAPQVIYVRNETAQGFVGACNRGADVARGEFIVFLNNDTEPTAGWLDELLFVFDEFEDVGLAGSILLYPDGRLQDAGGIVWGTGEPWNYGRGSNPRDPKYIYVREVDYVSGACIMISRSVWRQVGGFSAEFAPAYFEDTDLAFKVRKAGKRVVFVPTSLVYHYEGLSNGTDVSDTTSLKRFQEINKPKFKERWLNDYRNNGILGENVDLEKDRGAVGRVVFFDFDFPKPDENAGSYASFQEIRLFQSLGYKVTFVPITLSYLGRYTEQLQRAGVEVIYAPHFSSVEQFIGRRGAEFDLAYITRYQVAERVADCFRAAVLKLR